MRLLEQNYSLNKVIFQSINIKKQPKMTKNSAVTLLKNALQGIDKHKC